MPSEEERYAPLTLEEGGFVGVEQQGRSIMRHKIGLLVGSACLVGVLVGVAVTLRVVLQPKPTVASKLLHRGPLTKIETKDECGACADSYSKTGVIANPSMFSGAMTYEDVQNALHANCPEHCTSHSKRKSKEHSLSDFMRTPRGFGDEDDEDDGFAVAANDDMADEDATEDDTECEDTKKGDLCYDLIKWTVTKVITNPNFYKGISPSSSQAQVQLRLHRDRPGICPRPCIEELEGKRSKTGASSKSGTSSKSKESSEQASANKDETTDDEACHTAMAGEDCFDAVIWIMKEGIDKHPKWFPGLNIASTLEEVQEHLHTHPEENEVTCPMPCKEAKCRDVQEGEPCWEGVTWAMEEGIVNHSNWFKGLTVNSSFAEVQMNIHSNPNATVACPEPCEFCKTATEGDRCYSAVTWVMEEGIKIQPDCYPGLNQFSSFQEVQYHLHVNKSEAAAQCPEPCAVTAVSV